MPTYREDSHLGHKVPLVEADDILKGAITTDKISDGAVTTPKIADSAVTTEKIADGDVTGEKIQDGALTLDKLDPEFQVTERMIASESVTTDKIADDAVTTPKIADLNVTTPKIADEAVTEEKLAPQAVTTEKLADGVISQLENITDAEPTLGSVKPLQSGGAASVLGYYTENPEFVKAVLDNEDKVLCGIQKDGNFYFGAGCPQQIKDYVDEQLKVITDIEDFEERIEKLQEIIEWFEHLIEIGGLEALIFEINQRIDAVDAAKVDKEEGKSLIDAEYANGVHYIENPEFLEVKVDAEDRILEATLLDGTKMLLAGYSIDGITVKTVDSPEFIGLWLDAAEHILMAIKVDGDIYYGYGVPSQIKAYVDEKVAEVSPEGVQDIIDFIGDYLGSSTLQELLDKKVDGEYIDNPEYIETKLDAEDKVLEGTKVDGTKQINTDLELNGKVDHQGVVTEVTDNPEYIEAKVDAGGKLLEGINANGEKIFGIIPPQIKQYVDEAVAGISTGSGVSNIEIDDATGDIYATYDDESGVTDVTMDEEGNIWVESEE